jgi:hypothetical protein
MAKKPGHRCNAPGCRNMIPRRRFAVHGQFYRSSTCRSRAWRANRMPIWRPVLVACDGCGKDTFRTRAAALCYCGAACRMQAYRRRRQVLVEVALDQPCLGDALVAARRRTGRALSQVETRAVIAGWRARRPARWV